MFDPAWNFYYLQIFWFSLWSIFPTFTHICDFFISTEHKITRKFELESEEKRKKINESYTAMFENFNQEKEVTQCKHISG